jgi:hypothetical protein
VDILHDAGVTGVVHVDDPYRGLMAIVLGLYLKYDYIGKGHFDLFYVGRGEM